MKKRLVAFTLVLGLLAGCLTACSSEPEETEPSVKPEITQIRSICELATLECYYHNVAKSVKTAGQGFTHLLEKDREFWVEYDGIVKVGIDMSQVRMSVEGTDVTITIPEAQVMSVTVNEESYNSESIIEEADSINSNGIGAEDITSAVNEAQEQMKQTAESNSSLLMNAQDRAKDLIENYIRNIGEQTGTEYTLHWEYVDNDSSSAASADTAAETTTTDETPAE